MKQRTWALVILVMTSAAYADEGMMRVPMSPDYLKECGSCHVAFPAWGMDASSWKQMMGQLDRHFGSDASLNEGVKLKIQNYLQSQSATSRSQRSIPEKDLRMTQTPWFKKEHRKVRAAEWTSPKVKTASNCAACHQGATSGRYEDEN